MTNTEYYFCDTYAIIEMIGGNVRYRKYTDSALITATYNLTELYYALLRDYGEEIANSELDLWLGSSIEIPIKIIKQAMKFKLLNKKDNLSYVDCIGYIFSQENGMKFLTGDIKFKDKLGVEFVQ